MTKDSRQTGLLGRIIQVIIEAGEFKSYSSLEVMEMLKQRGEWSSRVAKTPARTIYNYFTQNPEIFKKAGLDAYRLQPEYKKKLQSDYHTDNFIVGAQYSRSDIYKILKVPSDKQGADWNNGYHREGSDYYIFCNVNTAGRTGHDYTNYWNEEILVWSGKTKSHFEQESIKKLLSDTYRKLIFYRTANQMPFTFAGVGTPKPHFDTNKPVRIDWAFPTTKQKTQMNEHSPFIKKTKTNFTQILKAKQQDDEQPTMGIQEAVELRLGLLSGQRHLEAFDRLSMQDVTDDEALCRIYDEAEIQCFSDFLALGKKRFKFPDYNQESELTLKASLRSHLRDHPPLNRGKSKALETLDSADKISNRTPNATPTLVKQSVAGDSFDSTESIQEAVELRLGLLYGRNHLAAFDRLSMQDVTDDEELCRIYDESKILSFSHFLALGNQRFLLPHYKQNSENMLKDILRTFLRKLTSKKLIKLFESTPLKCSLIQDSPTRSSDDPSTRNIEVEKEEPITLEQRQEIIAELIRDEERQEVVAELMKASIHCDAFDDLKINDITIDGGLCKSYNSKNAQSLSDFLAMGEKRLDIQDHGEESEERLKEELIRFLKFNPLKNDDIQDSPHVEETCSSTNQNNISNWVKTPPILNIKEQQHTSSPDTKEELSEASKYPQEISALPATEIGDFVEDLLAGNIIWEPFQKEEMRSLTTNLVLRHIYKNSTCANLSEFIALSEKRRNSSGKYWKKDEHTLKKELIKYFQTTILTLDAIESDTQTTQNLPENFVETIGAVASFPEIVSLPPSAPPPEHSINEIQSAQEDVDDLMEGSGNFAPFDDLNISDITRNVRLCNCYDNSNAENLSAFLAIGKKRFALRNYGKNSEITLRESLSLYFTHNKIDSSQQIAPKIKPIQHDQLIEQLRQHEKVKTALSTREWRSLRDEVKRSKFCDRLIFSTAAEIGMPWPIGGKSPLSEKKIRDYIDLDITEIMEVDRFGKKKVAVYVACIIHLHRKLSDNHSEADNSLKGRVMTAWENSRLTEREKDVLRLRFGIESRKYTLEEIATNYDVTRERIRQIQKKALLKLKTSEDYTKIPKQLTAEQAIIWEHLVGSHNQISKTRNIHKLESLLSFEEHLAIEISTDQRHRSITHSTLASWLDEHFEHDESNWYNRLASPPVENDPDSHTNADLVDFLDTL